MLPTIKEILIHLPVIREISFFIYRLTIALKFLFTALGTLLNNLFFWLIQSQETTNFTYDITAQNTNYLASLIADITEKEYQEIIGYIVEIENDNELREHVRKTIQDSNARIFSDAAARYGRRVGWYAFVRAIKPKIIIETGVDKGLGSCVLASALLKNKQEGSPGYYYGIDLNPSAGYLLNGRYRECGEIVYSDAISFLEKFDKSIDVFISDSDHTAGYEQKEYRAIEAKLSFDAILLGDNSHCTEALLKFALNTGRHFIFFQENPAGHWYPGAGIGIAFRRDLN